MAKTLDDSVEVEFFDLSHDEEHIIGFSYGTNFYFIDRIGPRDGTREIFKKIEYGQEPQAVFWPTAKSHFSPLYLEGMEIAEFATFLGSEQIDSTLALALSMTAYRFFESTFNKGINQKTIYFETPDKAMSSFMEFEGKNTGKKVQDDLIPDYKVVFRRQDGLYRPVGIYDRAGNIRTESSSELGLIFNPGREYALKWGTGELCSRIVDGRPNLMFEIQ